MPPRSKQPPSDLAPTVRGTDRRRTPRKPSLPVAVDVLAVLVAHDGAQWLPEVLAALAASTRVPARVVCVDTGSTDESVALMRAVYGEVLELPRTTGYGEAVAAAVASLGPDVPTAGWLWLLHDDVAVEPTTLQALLEHAATSPSAAMLGPKVRDWHDPRYLVEVGFTTDAAGHRETGLEHRERDQGQHDAVRDVLAVGTAAALVRRAVWDQVGGLDPRLTVFRDDLDLGWKVNAAGHRVVVVPTACVRHARAATTGHRSTDAAPRRASGTDRQHALYVLLAHAGPLRLLALLPRLLVATVLRSAGLLLTRQPGSAADEWRALVGVVGHPVLLLEARRVRASSRQLSQRRLRPLFVSRAVRMRSRLSVVGDWLGGGRAMSSAGALGDPGPEGPEYEDLAPHGPGVFRSLLLRPGVLVFLALSVVALVAERSVLAVHGGSLHGGALLAPPKGAFDLWAAYTASWHDVSVGTSSTTPPSTAALAMLSTLTFGKPWLAVDTLLLGSVPLAGLTAYLASGRLVRHRYLRLWVAATWALLPVATGAVAAGRIDAAVVQIALPVLALATANVLLGDPAEHGWWRVWALGLGMSGTCAFAPLLWPLEALVLLVGAVVLFRQHALRHAAAAALVAALPGVLLLPWSIAAVRAPSLFVLGQRPAVPNVPGWHLLLLSPGGPGLPVAVLCGGLVLAGLGGLVRRSFRRLAMVAWGVALAGFLVAGVFARIQVHGAPVWPGLPLQVAGLALLVAALVAGHGVRSRLAGHSFGWRQVTAVVIAAAAAALPAVAAVSWVVRGADDPLRRGSTVLLPAFASAELAAHPGLRALVLRTRSDGTLGYDLIGGDARSLADEGLRSSADQRVALDLLVADLTSPRGSDAAEGLSTRAVRYVALSSGPGSEQVLQALDAQAGLVRRSSGGVDLWSVIAPSDRLAVLPAATAQLAVSGVRAPTLAQVRAAPPFPLAAGREGAAVDLGPGEAGRLLVLADVRDRGWHATVDGKPLEPRTAWGWAQAFVIPAAGGHLELRHAQSRRQVALVAELLAVLAVAVLAVPAGRRRTGLVDDLDQKDDVEPGWRRHRAGVSSGAVEPGHPGGAR